MDYIVRDYVAFQDRQAGVVEYSAEGRFNSSMSKVLEANPDLVQYQSILLNIASKIHYYHYQSPFMMLHALKYLCEENTKKSPKTFKEYVVTNHIEKKVAPDFLRYVRMMEMVTGGSVSGCP